MEGLIVKYLALVRTSDQMVILTSWLPYAFTLEEYLVSTEEDQNTVLKAPQIRMLLIRLLLTLKIFHDHGVLHNDVCSRTILVHTLNLNGVDVLLTGFSRCSRKDQLVETSHPSGPERDCLAAFKVARHCLGHITEGTASMGHPWLDNLIEKSDDADWAYSVTEVCEQLDLKPGDCDLGSRPWKPVVIDRNFNVGIKEIKGEIHVNRKDLFDLLYPRGAQDHPSTAREIRSVLRLLLSNSNEYVSRKECKEMYHLLHDGTLFSMISLLKSLRKRKSQPDPGTCLSISNSFSITYHRPSCMFNITQLLDIATTAAAEHCTHDITFKPKIQEVRGHEIYDGHYVEESLLANLLERLDLTISTPIVETRTWSRLENFSENPTEENIVLVNPEVMGYAALSRTTRQITWNGQTWDSDTLPNEQMQSWRPIMDAPSLKRSRHWSEFEVRATDPSEPTMTATRHASFHDSSEDHFRFRYRSPDTERFGPSVDRRPNTEEWLNEQRESRNTGRKSMETALSTRGDIKPSVFVRTGKFGATGLTRACGVREPREGKRRMSDSD